MGHQLILILDTGGSYPQVLARRVRECGVYCEVLPAHTAKTKLQDKNPLGILLTGDTHIAPLSPETKDFLHNCGKPILALGTATASLFPQAEATDPQHYARRPLHYHNRSPLFQGIPPTGLAWMPEGELCPNLPADCSILAEGETCPHAAFVQTHTQIYALQYHPEMQYTDHGMSIIRNFLYEICHALGDWTMESYYEKMFAYIRRTVGTEPVLLGLSGGVDSAVAAALVAEAVGQQLTCVFIDNGLLRKDEGDEVEEIFRARNLAFLRVDAKAYFLEKLAGVSDPEEKRHIIGEAFIRLFEQTARAQGHLAYLVQGTIYPDVLESGTTGTARIKSHHNVGALPAQMQFQGILEPLRMLFKDEVRALGRALGLPNSLVLRQPFPGTGLAIRIIGAVTEEKLELLREADAIFRAEIQKAGLERSISQYFAVLTDTRTVGMVDNQRTYGHTLALRGVTTSDFMTASWAKIPYDVLEIVSTRIVQEVPNIGRVVYDITAKPPATIEWE